MRRLHTDEGTHLWAAARRPHSEMQQLVLALLVCWTKRACWRLEVKLRAALLVYKERRPLTRTRRLCCSFNLQPPDAGADADQLPTTWRDPTVIQMDPCCKTCVVMQSVSGLTWSWETVGPWTDECVIADKRLENTAATANKALRLICSSSSKTSKASSLMRSYFIDFKCRSLLQTLIFTWFLWFPTVSEVTWGFHWTELQWSLTVLRIDQRLTRGTLCVGPATRDV